MYTPLWIDDTEIEDGYIELYKDKAHYTFNGHVVPRTTEILSAMLHEQNLMSWSNHLGLYQRKEYDKYMDLVANIGTCVHKSIELFLTKYSQEKVKDISIIEKEMSIPLPIYESVRNGFLSFVSWFEYLEKIYKSIKVIAIEKRIVCEYFGGTVDCILELDGEIFLIDFKTSNYVSYKHFLQLSAYRYMLMLYYGICPDKCMILQLNKKIPKFKEYIFDVSTYGESYRFMERCQEEILKLSEAFKIKVCLENDFNKCIGKSSKR